MSRPFHVVEVADTRHPIAEPFAGGMQSLTWHLVDGLRRRGVRVSVFAGPGSDPRLDATLLPAPELVLSDTARADVSMPSEQWLQEHHAYLRLMLDLARRDDVDVVHNNSLHHLPVAMAETLPASVVTTLHTPPTPWLEPAVRLADPARSTYAAVSRFTAAQWAHVADPVVVPNGVDTTRWAFGEGGPDLVWVGRIAPEKGTHRAIDIARAAGRRLRVVGPVADPAYFRERVQPRLGDHAAYVGHLDQARIARLVGSSAACLVTPMWDEPYGLVAAEALSCGTPVLAFARGGLPEVVSGDCGRLVDGDDLDASVRGLEETVRLDRRAARRRAETHCCLERMVDDYVALLHRTRVAAA